jgi:ferric-dicitrate binding protein FerR (iron transport regulator)
MELKYSILPCLALFLLLSSPAYAVRGIISFVSGDADVIGSQGNSQKALKGLQVQEGDTLKTYKHSNIVLTLNDQSQIKLNANSEIKLGKNTADSEIELQNGGVFSTIHKKTEGHRFFIRTKTATMGVRGTEFFTAFGKTAKEGDRDVWMCVNDGQVEVENLKLNQKVMVNKGEGVFIHPGSKVPPPRPYSWTKTLNWNMDPAKGNVEDKSSIDSAYRKLVEQDYD